MLHMSHSIAYSILIPYSFSFCVWLCVLSQKTNEKCCGELNCSTSVLRWMHSPLAWRTTYVPRNWNGVVWCRERERYTDSTTHPFYWENDQKDNIQSLSLCTATVLSCTHSFRFSHLLLSNDRPSHTIIIIITQSILHIYLLLLTSLSGVSGEPIDRPHHFPWD